MIEWGTIDDVIEISYFILQLPIFNFNTRSPGPFTRIGRFRDGSGVGPGFGEMSPWPLALGATKPGAKVNRFSSSVFTAYSVAETTTVFYFRP